MKTLDYYMALPYRMEIVEDLHEGGYVISFPELPGCITCCDTKYDALASIAYKAPLDSEGIAVLPAEWDEEKQVAEKIENCDS